MSQRSSSPPAERDQTHKVLVASDTELAVQFHDADSMLGAFIRRLRGSPRGERVTTGQILFIADLWRWVRPANVTPEGNPYIWPGAKRIRQATGLTRTRYYETLAALRKAGFIADGVLETDEGPRECLEIIIWPEDQDDVARIDEAAKHPYRRKRTEPHQPGLFTSAPERQSRNPGHQSPANRGALVPESGARQSRNPGHQSPANRGALVPESGARQSRNPGLTLERELNVMQCNALVDELVCRDGFDRGAAIVLARDDRFSAERLEVGRKWVEHYRAIGTLRKAAAVITHAVKHPDQPPPPTREQLRRERLTDAHALDDAQAAQAAAALAAAERRDRQTLLELGAARIAELRDAAIAAETNPALLAAWRKRGADPVESPTLRAAMLRLLDQEGN